jgi:hypothetical protein
MASPRLTAEDIARLHEVGASLDPIDMVERRDATPPAGAGEAVAEVAERGFVRWLNGENILPIGTKLYAAPTPLPEAVRELHCAVKRYTNFYMNGDKKDALHEYHALLSAQEKFDAATPPEGAKPTAKEPLVPQGREPDPALLASMATCLNHGFGLLDAGTQAAVLADMRKLWAEVVGLGYYTPANRERYIAALATQPTPAGGST